MNQKVYLDACCLNRPFDEQTQTRIHLESEAILHIFQLIKDGKLTWFNSDVLEFEIENIVDTEKREKIFSLLGYAKDTIESNDQIIDKASEFEKLGFSSLDALHIASAASEKVDAMLTTDDKLEKNGKKNFKNIGIKIDNPLSWIKNLI